MRLPPDFHKMQGLGNDFVVLDLRAGGAIPGPAAIRRIADRRRGVGCDQVIMVVPSTKAAAALRFYNPDGGVGAIRVEVRGRRGSPR